MGFSILIFCVLSYMSFDELIRWQNCYLTILYVIALPIFSDYQACLERGGVDITWYLYNSFLFFFCFLDATFIVMQVLLMPILDGQAILYSFESTPEVRIGVAFGSGGSQTLPATELPGVSTWLVWYPLIILEVMQHSCQISHDEMHKVMKIWKIYSICSQVDGMIAVPRS